MRFSSRWPAVRRPAAMLLAATMFTAPAYAGTVAGTVVDGSGTASLHGAQVEIVELGRTAASTADGSYRFTDVPAGEYTLRIRYSGAETVEESIAVSDTGITRSTIALRGFGADAETILVIGQHANLASSLSRQRAADGIATILSRDAIGQFPDQNVAESLRRASGINVLNDQGEGRFVSVRGLDPNLNSTSINGNRVLATGGDERAAALDVIPSELIESIEIRKTLTPDMDGDTLGGSIEINTTSAFNRQRGFISFLAEGSFNELRDTISPKLGVDFSTRLGDNFGISGGANYHRRNFGSDNIEVGSWAQTDEGLVFAEEIDYRDYDVTRERIGASLSLDARVGSDTELYLRGLYSRFDDHEYRRRLVLIFNEEPASGTDTSASFDSADGRIEVRRDFKDRQEIQTIKTVSAGGRTESGPWRFVYDVSWSEARQFEDGSVDPVRFRRRFQNPGQLGLTVDYSRMEMPAYSVDFGSDAFYNAAGYTPTLLERTTDEDARDREYAVRADVTRSFALANGSFDIQGGVKARFRKKSLDFTIDVFDDFDGFTLADVVGRQTYGLGYIDPVPGASAWQAFYRDGAGITMGRNDLESEWASAAEDYRAREDILAGYLMGRLQTGALRLVGGVRVERTKNEFGSNLLVVNEDDETLTLTPVTLERDYTDWLPSIAARLEPARNVVLRAGAFRSVMRPKLSDIAPRFVIEENDEGEREGSFGNPDLMPYRAWNFDVSAEYYFARNAVIQAGAFYKRIDDFIVEAEFEAGDAPYDGVFNGIAFDEATIPLNGRRATVKGFEVAYQQALDFLPAPLDGFLVNFNYTYTDAKGRLADGPTLDGRRISLPAASKHTFNAVLGYEQGPVSLRLAGAYRSSYLDEISGDALEDRFVREHFQLDFSAKFRLTPNLRMVMELVNILDEPYVAYQRGPDRDRLLQYEEYGLTGKIGIRLDF